MKATFGMAAKRCNAWWVYCFIHGTLLGNSSFRDGILGTRAAEVKKTVLHDFCSLKGQEQSKQSETINNQTLRLFVFFLFIFLRIFWVFCSTFKFLMKSSHFFTFDTRSPSKFRCPRLRSGPGGNHRKVKAKITNLICMKILESTWSSVVKIHQNQSFNSFGSFCMYFIILTVHLVLGWNLPTTTRIFTFLVWDPHWPSLVFAGKGCLLCSSYIVCATPWLEVGALPRGRTSQMVGVWSEHHKISQNPEPQKHKNSQRG